MKKIFFGLGFYVLFLAALVSSPALPIFAANNIISWGLGVSKNEQLPTPPDFSDTMLKENNGTWVVDTQEKKVFFTFDLGYEAGYTAEVLDILKENNIKAIFFLCSNYLQQDELINRMIAEGHQIGNHTNRHKDLPTLSAQAAKEDIVLFTQKFNEKFKAPINTFRPPKGRFNEATLKLAKEQNLKTIMWSIAIQDWGKTPMDHTAMANKINSRIHPGAIILSHITNSGTPKMLRLLLPQLAAKGYTVGSPSEF